jgi:uroporphyrinogen decarboxylase
MKSKERVIAAIEGQEVDQLPTGFWYHFDPRSFDSIEATVENHLHFHQETDVDILKVMNENLFPFTQKIESAKDWLKVKPVGAHPKFIKKQTEITQRVVDGLGGKAFTLLTLHGTFASTWHARGGSDGYGEGSGFLARLLREDPKAMSYIFEMVAEAMCRLIDSVSTTGVDGIYYSALGGERYLISDAEYTDWVRPWDEKIFEHANQAFKYNFLHMCKDDLNLYRFSGINAAVVNWGSHIPSNPSLKEGLKHFPESAVLGGFDNTKGVLFDGDTEALKAHIYKIKQELGGCKVLLGADCTIQGHIDNRQLRRVKEAAAAVG